jgi:hypothetical protein
LVNSVIHDNEHDQIAFGAENGWNLIGISYCDIQGGRQDIITNDNGDVNWLDGNIDTDPLFTDPDNADFTLSENSPCIDAGTAFFVWENDTLLNLSPDDYFGAAPDIGAFESEYSAVPSDPFILYPLSFILCPAFPNPFNSATLLRFGLPEAGRVSLAIYDLEGQRVEVLAQYLGEAGWHTILWDASGIPAGIYFARLEWRRGIAGVKMVLVK